MIHLLGAVHHQIAGVGFQLHPSSATRTASGATAYWVSAKPKGRRSRRSSARRSSEWPGQPTARRPTCPSCAASTCGSSTRSSRRIDSGRCRRTACASPWNRPRTERRPSPGLTTPTPRPCWLGSAPKPPIGWRRARRDPVHRDRFRPRRTHLGDLRGGRRSPRRRRHRGRDLGPCAHRPLLRKGAAHRRRVARGRRLTGLDALVASIHAHPVVGVSHSAK